MSKALLYGTNTESEHKSLKLKITEDAKSVFIDIRYEKNKQKVKQG